MGGSTFEVGDGGRFSDGDRRSLNHMSEPTVSDKDISPESAANDEAYKLYDRSDYGSENDWDSDPVAARSVLLYPLSRGAASFGGRLCNSDDLSETIVAPKIVGRNTTDRRIYGGNKISEEASPAASSPSTDEKSSVRIPSGVPNFLNSHLLNSANAARKRRGSISAENFKADITHSEIDDDIAQDHRNPTVSLTPKDNTSILHVLSLDELRTTLLIEVEHLRKEIFSEIADQNDGSRKNLR